MSESCGFCPQYGDLASERPGPFPGMPHERNDVFCDLCYLEDFDFMDAPGEVQVRVCAQCGAIHRSNRWVDVGVRDYINTAIEEVSNSLGIHLNAEEIRWGVESEQVDENSIRVHCHFSGVVCDAPLEESIAVSVSIAREAYQHCDRIAGGYFVNLMQARIDDQTPTAEETEAAIEITESCITEREDKGDHNALTTEMNRTSDGPNTKISTNQTGNGVTERIRERFGGTIEEHPTLVAENGDDNEIYRVMFVTRLPRYTIGDVIDPEDDDGLALVRNNRGQLKGTWLISGDLYELEFEEGERPEAEDLGSVEDMAEIIVVAIEDEHAVWVLDPEMYEAETIPRPDYFNPDVSMAPVLKSPSGLHIFPEEVVDGDGE